MVLFPGLPAAIKYAVPFLWPKRRLCTKREMFRILVTVAALQCRWPILTTDMTDFSGQFSASHRPEAESWTSNAPAANFRPAPSRPSSPP